MNAKPNNLTGESYFEFWRKRMAKGEVEAGYTGSNLDQVNKQADVIMVALDPALKAVAKTMGENPIIAELGCGYGRMAYRMMKRFPNASFTGVDISPEAIAHCKSKLDDSTKDRARFIIGHKIPDDLVNRADLIYTCTCLQHITDEEIFLEAIGSIQAAAKRKDGWVILFENTYVPEKKTPHMRQKGDEDFLRHFKAPGGWKYHFEMDRTVNDHNEPHRTLVFRRVHNVR